MRKAFVSICKILWISGLALAILSGVGMIYSLCTAYFIRESAQMFVVSVGGACISGILGLLVYVICQCLDIETLF